MAQNGAYNEMNAGQSRFVAALLDSATITQAAELAHISRRTACRYLELPEVQAAISRQTDGIMAHATAILARNLEAANQTLVEIATSGRSESARVSAAKAILDASIKFDELRALAARVDELERRLECKQD